MTGLLICLLAAAGLGATAIGAVLLARTRAFLSAQLSLIDLAPQGVRVTVRSLVGRGTDHNC